MLRYWLWFSGLPNLKPEIRQFLLERFADPKEIYDADERLLRSFRLQDRALASLQNKDLSAAERILRDCRKRRIGILTIRDEAYPEQLREIQDPPAVLFYRGRIPDLSERPAIGIVGARNASDYAKKAAFLLGKQVSGCGGVVVTGLARGVDSCAARGALRAGGSVIGVLGCGADVVYPQENAELYDAVEQNGCLLTEYPPGTGPKGEHFPVRNRIISGLSDGVVIVEAGEKSGSLITARHAAEQGRDVFAVPGSIFFAGCRGSNELLRNGAIPVSSGWEAVQEYAYRYPDTITEYREQGQPELTEQPTTAPPARQDKPIDLQPILPSLGEEERRLLLALQDGECQLDELIDRLQLPAARALTAMTMLEVKGCVKGLPGKRYRLATEAETEEKSSDQTDEG